VPCRASDVTFGLPPPERFRSRPRAPAARGDRGALVSGSRAAREILGEPFVDHYVRTRDWEARQYERAVTEWELERYFEAV